MKGTWNRLSPGLMKPSADGPMVDRERLRALPFHDLCKMLYDPETPETVVFDLKTHPDAAVRQAAKQRPAVLLHDLLNPYEFT